MYEPYAFKRMKRHRKLTLPHSRKNLGEILPTITQKIYISEVLKGALSQPETL